MSSASSASMSSASSASNPPEEVAPSDQAPATAVTQGPEYTRGARGNLQELPLPTRAAEELASSVLEMLRTRGLSQTALCCQLSLSPVYFSIWLKGRPMPELTKQLYSAAIELWLDDEQFHILDPSITRTNPSQVPRSKGGKSLAEVKERAPTEPGGRAKAAAPKGSKQERDQLSVPTTPYGLLAELLSASPSGMAPSCSGTTELAFQLHSGTRPLPSAFRDGGVSACTGIVGAGGVGAGVGAGMGAALVSEAEASLLIVHAKLVLEETAAGTAPTSATAVSETTAAEGLSAGEAIESSGSGGGSGGGGAGSGGSPQVLWIEFRIEGDAAPLAVLLANGAMRAPDDVPAASTEDSRAAVLALTERPQRYRRTPSHHRENGMSSERSLLARALADSRRTAAEVAAAAAAAAAAAEVPETTTTARLPSPASSTAAAAPYLERAALGHPTAAAAAATATAATAAARPVAASAATDLKSIRRQLLSTLQAMAAAPLQIRQRRRQALDLASAWGEGRGMWVGFCSCCGRHFERLDGTEQLAAHAGVHLVHSHLQRVRREELPAALNRLRAAATVGASAEALRLELEGARRLGRLVPDGALQRAMVMGEARLRVLDRPRAALLPPTVLPPTVLPPMFPAAGPAPPPPPAPPPHQGWGGWPPMARLASTVFPPTVFPPTGFPPTVFPPTGFPPTGFPPTPSASGSGLGAMADAHEASRAGALAAAPLAPVAMAAGFAAAAAEIAAKRRRPDEPVTTADDAAGGAKRLRHDEHTATGAGADATMGVNGVDGVKGADATMAAAAASGTEDVRGVAAKDVGWRTLLPAAIAPFTPSTPFTPAGLICDPMAMPGMGPFGMGSGGPTGLYPPAHSAAYASALMSRTGHLPEPPQAFSSADHLPQPPPACATRDASTGRCASASTGAGGGSNGAAMSTAPPVSTYSASGGTVIYNVLDTSLYGNWQPAGGRGRQPIPSAPLGRPKSTSPSPSASPSAAAAERAAPRSSALTAP